MSPFKKKQQSAIYAKYNSKTYEVAAREFLILYSVEWDGTIL
jgi:hypothetical protein